tara:strand:+ start:6845 stop:7009 length:165 start_codon:yes stop_codon:yes gene_type:complete
MKGGKKMTIRDQLKRLNKNLSLALRPQNYMSNKFNNVKSDKIRNRKFHDLNVNK